jgi:hypothetical protein
VEFKVHVQRRCGLGEAEPAVFANTVEECVKQILEDYKCKVERLRTPPPPPDMAEELLKVA